MMILKMFNYEIPTIEVNQWYYSENPESQLMELLDNCNVIELDDWFVIKKDNIKTILTKVEYDSLIDIIKKMKGDIE